MMKRNSKRTLIKEDTRNLSDLILSAVLLVAILMCFFAGYRLFQIFGEYKEGTEAYNKIQQMVVDERIAEEVEIPVGIEPTTAAAWEAPITVDFLQLKKINEDIVGWIYIEAIPSIHYPIVKGEDNDYYLHRTYEKTDNFAGTLFIDCENSADLSDCNTIIYGHNMKNGSMFGKLKNFKSKETIDLSRYIWILTPDGDFKYEIFSVYTAKVGSETYTLFKGPGQELVDYGISMQTNSLLDFGEYTFDKMDKIITLSTCTGNDSTRFVVQAVRIDP